MRPGRVYAVATLNREQRLPVVVALREEGHSTRAIAGALGVSKSLVHKDLKRDVSTGGHVPAETTGLDGKTYPASKPHCHVMCIRHVASIFAT